MCVDISASLWIGLVTVNNPHVLGTCADNRARSAHRHVDPITNERQPLEHTMLSKITQNCQKRANGQYFARRPAMNATIVVAMPSCGTPIVGFYQCIEKHALTLS